MAVKSSGSLALSEIQTEWLGSNPIGMSEYYGDGDYLPAGPYYFFVEVSEINELKKGWLYLNY